jgi:predicted CXXCH cytochrome family protein
MSLAKTTLIISILVAGLFAAGHGFAQDNSLKFKLKPGADGKLCLKCHPAFEDTLKKPFVHTPLKNLECTGCHNPHTSAHGKLLAAEGGNICAGCHGDIVPKGAKSTHKVVLEGKCLGCHDPHAANNKSNLLKPGNQLCADCHKAMLAKIAKVTHPHRPVENCTNCHLPHASAKASFLLKEDVIALCTGCHKTNSQIFARRHMNYPVAGARCTGCHDPHGSDRPAIMYNNVHKPVAARMCNNCHEDATSATPLKTKKQGEELCKSCHATMMQKMTGRNRVHWPILSKEGCLQCHNPHASSQKGLLKAPMLVLCGKCHADTIRRQQQSLTKHEPIQMGLCTSCHDPHATDNQLLFKEPSVIDVCAACHDWQRHSTHPIGDKVTDKRNKNLTVNCLSCHRAHGTEYKTFIPFPSVSELCVQCHAELKR